ncbi:PQQ-like beta-propeller repeat protein [Natronomonas halophila]|uniref:outer membrane protein assembly factor BamB family protein n=1 Tax=Natronomonas halophila TaxID=2747817 RepID=UPI0015B602BF|nr:PQQ-binding-like beta-propeller repeat protein [Natronomonas halophila]QLD85851.1 PQQ-like beta-propeller repeat protein [Natronomonas halophila]
MSKTATRLSLGEVDPCGSRQAGRRSGLALTDEGPVVGLDDGSIRAFDSKGRERWHLDGEGSAITHVPFADGVLVGERSARGAIRFISNGEERWRHDAADVIGDPSKETRFFLPMVVNAAVAGDTAYVAARRYERQDGGRHFESAIYALAPDGSVRWRYDADASPISLDSFDDGVAVAYNRCPGSHDDGLVVLDGNGSERWTWDPEGDSEDMLRRVGDVSAADGSLFITSHADYRGYRLTDGAVDWRVDLGTPLSEGDEVYAYPNHVYATESGVCFQTGNSFPEEGRETDERHPNEQSAFGYTLDGEWRWRADIGGFSHEIATDGDRLLVPVAQHFRDRDPSVHGWHALDVADGRVESGDYEGVVTAAAIEGDRRVLIEEPVRYHDGETVLGKYALRRP